ncbi:hypothetical protein J4447_04565 [Candidatus Pacearchaeota archaeon]|nr:hypothetical protein [Candidatus Pacearchaeota archaeon]
MEKEIQELVTYGLTDNEARVYLANLRCGSCKAQFIAKEAKLLRTTAYEVLKTLSEKGLISSVIKSGVKYFEAADPKKLIQILEEKKNKIKPLISELANIKETVKEKPGIQVYQGKEGLQTILDDIINNKPKEILTISSAKILQVLEFYFPNWIRRRVRNKIYARVLQEKVKELEEMKLKDKNHLREIRFLSKNFTIKTHTQIYASKVAILTLSEEELFGIIIVMVAR